MSASGDVAPKKDSMFYWLLRIHGSAQQGYRLGYSGYTQGIHASCTMTVASEHPWFDFIHWAAAQSATPKALVDRDTLERLVLVFQIMDAPTWAKLYAAIENHQGGSRPSRENPKNE